MSSSIAAGRLACHVALILLLGAAAPVLAQLEAVDVKGFIMAGITSVADAVEDRDSVSARIASCLLSGFAVQYACESFVVSSNALRIARDTSASASRVDAAATAPSRDNFLSAASRLESAAATTASAPTGPESLSRAFLPRALAAAEVLAPRPPRRCGGT